jgi:hypothetical protein
VVVVVVIGDQCGVGILIRFVAFGAEETSAPSTLEEAAPPDLMMIIMVVLPARTLALFELCLVCGFYVVVFLVSP